MVNHELLSSQEAARLLKSPEQASLLSFENSEAVKESLKGFTRLANESGLVTDLVQQHMKKNRSLRQEEFVFESISDFECDPYNGTGEDFSLDSNFALVLGYKRPTVTDVNWIALTSFCGGLNNGYEEVDDTYVELWSDPQASEHTPVIEQIQGFHKDLSFPLTSESQMTLSIIPQADQEEAVDILQSFIWPRVLFDGVIEWAKSENLPRVFSQSVGPGGSLKESPLDDKLGLYLNVTAKKSGFKKQPSGLYMLDLAY